MDSDVADDVIGFIERHAEGLEPLLEAASSWPLEKAAAEARVEEAALRELTERFERGHANQQDLSKYAFERRRRLRDELLRCSGEDLSVSGDEDTVGVHGAGSGLPRHFGAFAPDHLDGGRASRQKRRCELDGETDFRELSSHRPNDPLAAQRSIALAALRVRARRGRTRTRLLLSV